MTQDQSLDSGHQVISNNHPTNDQAGDDLNISKNSTVSNGVNSVQDFNVVANSKRCGYSTDAAIMQNRSVDAISAAAGNIFVNSNQSVVGSNDNIISEESSSNYVSDATKSGVDKLISEMTVITHQNSGENIREIIENSNETNKISHEAQSVKVESNSICEKNVADDANTETKKPNPKEIIKPEDPIDRLNKLRASISNALSEVKGVLRQYSTDQDCDGENKCSSTEQQTDKGPVKFRFVRKIRRRSVFSEDENEQNAKKVEQIESRMVNTENANLENKTSESQQNQTKIQPKESSSVIREKCDDKTLLEKNNSDTSILVQSQKMSSKLDPPLKILDVEKARQEVGNGNDSLAFDSPRKVLKQGTPISLDPDSATSAKKLKSANTKAIKKERRASIAAVHLNQGLNDELVAQLELKRRPSDSGTFVKQPTEIKSKIKKKVNVRSQNQTKTEATTKTMVPKAVKSDVLFDKSGSVQISTREKSTISIDDMPNMTPKNENIEVSNRSDSGDVIQITNNLDLVEVQSQISQSTKGNSPYEKGNAIEGNTTNYDKITTEEAKSENTSTIENAVVAISSSQTNDKINEKVAKTIFLRLDKEAEDGTELKIEVLDLPSPATILNNLDTKTHPTSSSDKKLQTVKFGQSKTQQLTSKVENKRKLTKSGKSENKLITVISDTKVEEQTKLDQTNRNVEKGIETTSISELDKSVSLDLSKDNEINELDLRNQDLAPVYINNNSPANTNTTESSSEVAVSPKKKKTAKRKVVIRRIKRKLSKDDTFIHTQETPAELEVCEKEIEEKIVGEESEEEAEIVPVQRRPCLKRRQFEIGDIVMYAERFKRTQVKWRKATVIERITSISYKLNIEGEEKPAHISYIKKFTDRKVNFGGKEYLEIDYAQIEEDEEKERNYSIWNLA